MFTLFFIIIVLSADCFCTYLNEPLCYQLDWYLQSNVIIIQSFIKLVQQTKKQSGQHKAQAESKQARSKLQSESE